MRPMAGGAVARWERKALAESLNPEFPAIDVATVPLPEYNAAVAKLLRDASIPQAHFSLAWRDLSVTAPLQAAGSVPENVFVAFSAAASAVRNGCARVAHPHDVDAGGAGAGKDARVLDGVSGRLEPGETCLVLGPSGAGSSLLLQRLAGRQIGTVVKTGGEVLYDGQKKLAGVVKHAHVVALIGQEDVHTPELSVRDTLRFAADCKFPEWFPHVAALRRNHISLITRMLGIDRVLDTVVGSDSLRGCSGGERKRVTFAEMAMSPDQGVVLLDNFSKGLDSATTLSICRAIARYAGAARAIVVASMGAPGLASYSTFSHLTVLDSGKLLYFGRRDQAEAYFVGLGFVRPPSRSVPDFIATISDPAVNGQYVPAGGAAGVPMTADALASRFAESAPGVALRSTLSSGAGPVGPEFDVPPDLVRLGRQRSLQGLPHQFRAVLQRQLRVLAAKRRQYVLQVCINVVFGLVLGSVFWQLPETQAGGNSRAGLIFLALLFIGLNALSTIPQMSMDKAVHRKHSASAFYMSMPYVVSLLAYDMATQLIKAAAFVVPLYLMAGMQIGSSGQRLLYTVLILWIVANVMQLYTRSLVAVFDSADGAQALGGFTTILLVLTSGYLKSGDQLQSYLVWLYWANPLHYAYEALALNEFTALTLACTPSELLPDNTAVANANRVCLVSTGELYLADFLSITEAPVYRLYYFCILAAYLCVLVVVAAVAVRMSKPKGFAAKAKPTAGPGGSPGESVALSVDDGAADHPAPTRLTFSGMSYSVQGGAKLLLNSVSGVVPPRQMVACTCPRVLRAAQPAALQLQRPSSAAAGVRPCETDSSSGLSVCSCCSDRHEVCARERSDEGSQPAHRPRNLCARITDLRRHRTVRAIMSSLCALGGRLDPVAEQRSRQEHPARRVCGPKDTEGRRRAGGRGAAQRHCGVSQGALLRGGILRAGRLARAAEHSARVGALCRRPPPPRVCPRR
jgi:ABC-type multidrug transport system ATPase subunit